MGQAGAVRSMRAIAEKMFDILAAFVQRLKRKN
jgi:hypothetical protein